MYSANAFENNGLSKLDPAPLSVIVCALGAWPAVVGAAAAVGGAAGAVIGFAAPAGGLVGVAAGAVVGIGVLADVQPAKSRIPHMVLARRRSDIRFILPGAFSTQLVQPRCSVLVCDSIYLNRTRGPVNSALVRVNGSRMDC